MPLPADFNEVENLQDIVRREHNKAVKAWFKNQSDNDVSTPKARLKHSCLIKDDDSIPVTQLRLWLFEVTVGRMQAIQAPVISTIELDEFTEIKYRPQVQLFFQESQTASTYDPDYYPVEGQISFRLMDETSATMTRAKAETLARNIKKEFATPLFSWDKGWFYCSYRDSERGYLLKFLVKSKAEGERVVKQVLKIQSHTFNDNFFQFVDHDRTYPAVPGTATIYGRTRKKSMARPRAEVRFKHAKLLIHGLNNAINLVDVGGRLRSVIERV